MAIRKIVKLGDDALRKVCKKQLLLKILSAADEKQVKLCEISGLPRRNLRDLGRNAAPLQTAAHAENIAPVAVKIQEIGIQMADAQGNFAHSQNSFPPSRFCSWPRRSSMAVYVGMMNTGCALAHSASSRSPCP